MKKILVIDDEPDVAELLHIYLSSLGYNIEVFQSCEGSLESIEGGNCWAVFCDYMMPGITGDKLYKKIKEKNEELAKRFVIITGAVMDERLERFLNSENVTVINKPFRLDEIKDIIRNFEDI